MNIHFFKLKFSVCNNNIRLYLDTCNGEDTYTELLIHLLTVFTKRMGSNTLPMEGDNFQDFSHNRFIGHSSK